MYTQVYLFIISLIAAVSNTVLYSISTSDCAVKKIAFISLTTLLISFLALTVLIWLSFIIFSLFISRKKEYKKLSPFYSKLFNFYYKYLCSLAGVKVKISGLEKFKAIENQRFLLVSNHRSKFDNMIECIIFGKRHISFISKKENFKLPFIGRYMKRNLYLSLDRGNLAQNFEEILKSMNFISSDLCSIGVFPEGTRSKDLTLLEFKPGCFKIATKTKSPIVVVALSGTENIHKKWWTRNVKVNVDVLEVLTAADYENKKTTEISDSIYSLIKSHLDLNSK